MSEMEEYGGMSDYSGGSAPGEDVTAYAGKPLESGTPPAARDAVIEALRTVHDPEIPVNIYELGLVYDIRLGADGNVAVDMTLTAPACPVAGAMPQQVADAVAAVPGVGEVEVNLVWEPPWSKDMMSEEAKVALDMW
ncbi:MAG TPA: SUF system Fe-S cluster assembly protein [Candidatus Sulfotelmatobacter sp.]|nr:SUF system Fe-S cluster assembly protein [Candidatus Sulfotelmatobacter sp.]